MQEENFDRFDLLVKETMADAEVKVPSGVWKVVASRIGATTAAGASTILWRWTAPALAFAAAAVALFVIPRTSEKTIVESSRQVLSVRTTASAFEPSAELFDVPAIASRSELAPREIHSPASFELVAADREPALKPAESNPQEARQQISEPQISEEEFVDPFEALLNESGQKKNVAAKTRKTSILVGNTVGANDTHYNNTTFGPQFASGTKAVSDVHENSVSNFAFPISIGLGVKHQIADRFSAGVGLSWTQLSRNFNGSYKTEDGNITHKVQYIGIPVNFYYDILEKKTLQIYALAGGSVEKCIYNNYFLYEKSASPLCKEAVKGLQYGIDLGLGVEFKCNDFLSIYIDPAAKYWFAGAQPKTVRTEKPLIFSIEGGIRFNL